MILTPEEASVLKKEIAARLAVPVHFHDGCGGQFFSLEQAEDAGGLPAFFAEKGLRAAFSEDGLLFTLEEEE